ncbi:hypothetical protein BU24DRAFT_46554 [Aaosphaeria arxii CBS 175.79]|uniref:FAD-binding FR-type domain-containing protein n=1 Tax=Aaosphaeria arxii CBS 175.79 TaxID=1450172 RepID=A0A6A5XDD9_9PLEO|nr:uncharacterized protein BU24DRAFT_46554 [Aaosphaeria arxii CBS 175.79]KAF2010817.1 hypothetical protein BU24DRAFT_46554 [Aaosphaeria arxii CBS 175.79]
MSSYLAPRAVEQASSLFDSLTRRHVIEGGFLKGWDAEKNHDLRFSFGLTGVDQIGNYLWVDVLVFTFIAIGGFTLILFLVNIVWRQMRHVTTMGNPTRQEYWEGNRTRWWPWINRHVLMAPLHKKRHNRGFQISSAIDNGTLPGRWHTLILTVYVAANIAWCCILPWNEERASVVAALRGRSGTLSALNMIPTVLFALRNNPLISILQVSYDDFNLFHRWAARITILEAIVHTVAWLANTAEGGGWVSVANALRTESSYTWGMVGTCAFTLIGIQAASPLRHAFYETFLNIHRLMAWVAFVGVWVHLRDHGLPQIPWMQLIFILYGLEIFARIVRVWYNSVRVNGFSRVKVEAMPGEAVRVTIDLVRPWYARPGCHVHLYIPTMTWLSSHPFSVAWAPTAALDSKEMTLPTLEGQILSPHAPKKSNQISLICRARTGFTRQMFDRASASPNETFTTWGMLEGPYGGHHSLDSYGTVVLFAGGVGITHQVMYIKHLIDGAHRGTTSTQKIVLIWTVPNSECLEWIRPWMDEILRMPGRKKVLRVLLFISRPKRALVNTSETVKMLEGRPNHAQLTRDEFRNRVGAMAVTVCAGGAFADEVRAAVRPLVTEGSIDFIEEAFTY